MEPTIPDDRGDGAVTSAVVRRPEDAIALVAGLAVTLVLAGFASGPAPGWEVEMFRAINGLTHDFERALWPIQQLGMALAIPVGAVVLGLTMRSWKQPALLVVLSAGLGWGAANIMREAVNRGRPGSFLDSVQLGYDVPTVGAAFPSGHAIVVLTLIVVFAPYVPPWWLIPAGAVALVVMLVRVYVGAHMPLDILAGATFGVAVGATVNLVGGVRTEAVLK